MNVRQFWAETTNCLTYMLGFNIILMRKLTMKIIIKVPIHALFNSPHLAPKYSVLYASQLHNSGTLFQLENPAHVTKNSGEMVWLATKHWTGVIFFALLS